MSDLKVADLCPKCKNCKSTTRECDGKKDWLTEVECVDPCDGMKRILAADSDICCSMFEPITSKDKYSELEARYSDNDVVIEAKRLSEESRIEEIREGLMKITKAFTNEELIKASKRKDELIQYYREKLKKANNEINLLNSKLDKLGEYYRTNEKLIDNIQKAIFPQEESSDYTYSYDEILNKAKELKVQSDENGTMYEEIKELREKNKVLREENDNLKGAVKRRDKWIEDLRSDVDTLQNECLVIADIAKRAYDESIAIKEENGNG